MRYQRAEVQYVTYTVNGPGQFPLDMLRYDGSWPATSDDVDKIHCRMSRERDRRKEPITLRAVATHGTPETARWESFLWKVTEVR